MIELKEITLQIGTQELLHNASFSAFDNQKIGIVGPNGCGKSTLFKLIIGEIEGMGDVFISPTDRLAFVEQIIEDTSLSVKQYVLQKDRYLSKVKKEYEQAPDEKKAELYEDFKRLGGETAEAKVAEILAGLGFKNEDLDKPVSSFSGGWQMRLNLAGALFQPSTVLLLDEPTNHLDLESVIWLQNFLKKYSGTLLLISHDKTILNEVCSSILVFQNKTLVFYSGNYDAYLTTKALQDKVLIRQAEKEKEKREHLEAFINRFRYKASKAKQAQSRIKMLEKMLKTPAVYPDKEERFFFLDPLQALPPLIMGDNVSVGYEDKTVLRKLSFSISDTARIALLGENGNGKSTFAKLLTGILNPKEGELHFSSKLKVGYFSQHQEEMLPLNETPVSYFETLMVGKKEAEVRSYLALFGLQGDKALTSIKKLSGGEKTRLLFAKIALDRPNLLILDEPTNHLDIKGREGLAVALNDYKGAIILITHDFSLIEEVAEDLWLVKNERCAPFEGDLSDYKKLLLEKPLDKAKKRESEEKKASKLIQKQNQAEKRKIKAEILSIERQIKELTSEKENLEKLFETMLSSDKIIETSKKITTIQKNIDLLEEKWFSLAELTDE